LKTIRGGLESTWSSIEKRVGPGVGKREGKYIIRRSLCPQKNSHIKVDLRSENMTAEETNRMGTVRSISPIKENYQRRIEGTTQHCNHGNKLPRENTQGRRILEVFIVS